MSKRTFSASSLVTCWLLVITQHKQLVEELAGTKGLHLDRHVRNLAVHMMELLEDQTINRKAVEKAKRAHDKVDAFGEAKRHMAVFVLDAFALTAHAAGLPQLGTFDAINNLALAHEAPVEVGYTLATRAERAADTLATLKHNNMITSTAGIDVISAFTASSEGRKALRLDDSLGHTQECLELLSHIKRLAKQTEAQMVIDDLVKHVS